MADNLIDDIKIVLSADDKAAKGPIDDLIAKLEGIGKAAEGNGNATKEFFDRIAKGGEEASKSMGKLADAAGKSSKGVKDATKGFSEIADSAERVVPAAEDAKKALDGMSGAGDKIAPFGGGEKYLTFLDSLADKAIQAGSVLKTKLADGARAAGKALAKLSISPITMPLKAASGAIKKMTGAVSGLFRQIKRVAMYRAIRSAIRMVTDGFKEGTANAYQWSKAMGGEFASKMDMLATSSLYLKNSLGALVTPLVNAVAPAIDMIVDKFIALLNVANQVIALLTGATSWTKAVKYPKEYAAAANEAAGGAGKLAKAMTTILSIDELNPLNADNSGGGGGGGGGGGALDYSSMFEEQSLSISSSLASMFEPFKRAWEEKGQGVLDAFDNALSGIETLISSIGSSFWSVWQNGTGQKTIEHILGILTGILDTVGNISKKFAEGWNTDNLGTGIIQDLWNALNDVLGLWERITKATADWAKELNFEPVIRAFKNFTGALEPVVATITDGLGWAWENVLLPLGKWAVESALPSVLDTMAGILKVLNPLLQTLGDIFKFLWDNVISPLASAVGTAFTGALDLIASALDKIAEVIEKLKGKSFKEIIADLFGSVQGGDAGFIPDGAGTMAMIPLQIMVDKIVDKVPAAEKVISGISGWVAKMVDNITSGKTISSITGWVTTMTDKITSSKTIKKITGWVSTMSDKITGSKTIKKINGWISTYTDKITGSKTLKKFKAWVDEKVDKIPSGNKYVDKFKAWLTGKDDKIPEAQRTVNNITARFDKSQNAMSEEQRRFYATARFNQSQNALGTPSFNAKANFTDYSSEFSKVRMALQITEAYGPNGNRIQLKAGGGAFYGGQWHDIAQYATGGLPDHGTLFAAGESGTEVVGHIGGRTEVLNQSQLASTMAAATQMGMASQNGILQQIASGISQLVEGQGDIRAYIPAGEVVTGLQRNNRRDGRALVPMGV